MAKKFNVKGNTIITPVFRANHVHLDAARQMNDTAQPKFDLSAAWDNANFTPFQQARWDAMMKEVDRVSVEAFGKPLDKLPGNYKKGIRDNDEREGMAGYPEGGKFASLTAGVKYRPGVVVYDREKKENIPVPAENVGEVVYSGCYCEATVVAYPYDNQGKGIALGLRNIRKVANGERLDGAATAIADFEGSEYDEELPEGAVDIDDEIPF